MKQLGRSIKSDIRIVGQYSVLGCAVAIMLMQAGNVHAKNSPESTETTISTQASCSGAISAPAKLTLPIGKSTLINLPDPLATRTVGNQSIVQSRLISPLTLYVLGMDIGATNMILQSKNGNCAIIDIAVTLDPDALQQMLAEVMPYEKNIKVRAASDSLILSGTVEDALSAARAVEVAEAYVRRFVAPASSADAVQGQQQLQQMSLQLQRGQQQGVMNTPTGTGSPRVINMLSVTAQQQVMLEVKVAEISKTLLDKFGSRFAFPTSSGSWTYSLLANFLTTSTSATGGSIGGVKTDGKSFAIDGQKDDGLIKILAEPSIMAISGQEGSFLAGGTIFIPVAQAATGVGSTVTLEEKQFGVGVKFTPTVLAGGKINLKVAPEVSELNKEGVGITATGITGTAILPAFTVRKASTTVQLMDGQTFAIGGLIKNNTTTNIKAFPFLGEIPILGVLFRSTQFQKDKTELVFMVTPRLVKPLSPGDIKLPTDNYIEPTRKDLFLNGKTEGQPKSGASSTSPTDASGKPAEGAGFDVK